LPGPTFRKTQHAGIKPAATNLCEHLRLENESIASVAAGFTPACFGFAKCGLGNSFSGSERCVVWENRVNVAWHPALG